MLNVGDGHAQPFGARMLDWQSRDFRALDRHGQIVRQKQPPAVSADRAPYDPHALLLQNVQIE